MGCNFSNLKFGEITRLSGGSSCCAECGTDLNCVVENNLWKYCGHSGDMDLFEATKLIYCSTCGIRISGYGERCGESGGLQIELKEFVPVEIKKEK